MGIDTFPRIITEADIRALGAALETANELIDRINTVKELVTVLDGMVKKLEVNLDIKFDGEQAESKAKLPFPKDGQKYPYNF